jgi:membrane protein YdbS with pleckstrin-like domain
MVAAVAVGVGVYFAFTALWELQAYVAVVASPAVVTGLVAGAQAWRHRQGRGPLEVRVLAVLLFTGTLLTIAPAGALLSGG